MNNQKLKGGIYLVIDPETEEIVLIKKLRELLTRTQIAAVQIWDNFKDLGSRQVLINIICDICAPKNVPVLLNNSWELLNSTNANGVHFDEIPFNYTEIKKSLPENALVGLTCNNDLETIEWANKNGLDYISFCSIFPSSTSNSCELVDFKNILKARSLTQMPIFLAGGIKPGNVQLLKALDFDGIAVISGIMEAENPSVAAENYYSEINKLSK